MAATLRRSDSRELPPYLSELMNKREKHAASFIKQFDSSERRMREIVREFREIAAKVRKMQERTDKVRRTALGMPLGLLAGGAAVAAAGTEAAGAAAAAVIATVGTIGVGIAAGSAILVAGANVTKGRSESGSVHKVKQLWKDFMEIIEPLKNDLEEIKTTFKKLEQRSAEETKKTCEKLEQRSAEETVQLQAEKTLTDMEDFQTLTVVSILGRGEGVMSAMWNVFTLTASPEEDRKLTDSIIQSADCCQEVIDDLKKMKEELKDFTEQ
ncbi:uncharacterized protein LOC116065611 [Sander lucioperca]|uniref:uncharacterized protein LOC116065611 n=1 Tax=Sander lucioperca TaxID=283035 RepID=UPI00125E4362|nr:uncharacterized protein LOC116065611 [Sander lucioperca]